MLLDIDGDGRAELVIAGPNDHPDQARVEAGTTFVFFGTDQALPSSVDLGAIPTALSHLVINGADDLDMLAYSMGHGDVNGDGLPELVLNAMGGNGFNNLLVDAGDAYVLDAVELTHAAGREIVPTRTPTETPTQTVTAAGTATATPTIVVNATPTSTPSLTPSIAACRGDCDGDGAVNINELIIAVRIALSELAVSACTAVDADNNGAVEIGELITAVGHSLSGCS
jgi:hypothetical protein